MQYVNSGLNIDLPTSTNEVGFSHEHIACQLFNC